MSNQFKLKFGDESELAHAIRKAIGVGPYDEVDVQTPQFDRTDGKQIIEFPSTVEMFARLKTFSPEKLKEIGLQLWDENGLWLFPGEWYNFIPQGYEVTGISYRKEKFEKGVTDDDIMFGCLAYGLCCTPPISTAKEEEK